MFLWWGDKLTQFYNDAYRPSLGSNGKHPSALGQPAVECWPEIWPVIKPLIDQVLAGGDAVWQEDQLIPIYRNGQLEDVYWTFGYSAVLNDTGKIEGVLVICHETTEKVNTFNYLQRTKEDLEFAQREARSQNERLKSLFMQAPAGICILSGQEFTFELINPRYQALFPGRDLLGKPLVQALHELQGQHIISVLQEVYSTGIPFEGNELLVPLARTDTGHVEDRYFNFVYQPRLDVYGHVNAILTFVFEVTDIVRVKKELETAEETLKLSLLAAELGTFDMDLEKGTMYWDDRCRTLFGISHKDTVTYEKDFLTGLHIEDRDKIKEIIDNVFIKSVSNGDYDVQYRTIGVEDGIERWVRAKGKAYFDKNDIAVRFIGSVLDITELKYIEKRKNDFIAIVSHELKTPLTALKAYIQTIERFALKSNEEAVKTLVEKSNKQVAKMNDLINGFLNTSRLDEGSIALVKSTFNICDLISSCVENITDAHKSHLILFTECSNNLIEGDYDKLGQVINNFLTNAIKYSLEGSSININSYSNDKMVIVKVTDRGIGIKPENLENLFKRFYRDEAVSKSRVPGFGIGLYLAAEIVQCHGGEIWVESEYGKGSSFYFSIPND